MKIDFHTHTMERSRCGIAKAVKQIEASIVAGLDAIAFTDHGKLTPAPELARLNKQYAPFLILDGIEITIEEEDVLVIGINDPALESEDWGYPGLHAFVRERSGMIALAHPFRYCDEITIPYQDYPPDAIEVCSSNTPSSAMERIEDIATDLQIPMLSNSDAHSPHPLGIFYNLLDTRPRNTTELLRLIKKGNFTAIGPEAEWHNQDHLSDRQITR